MLAGAVLALGFIHNIIRRHPACMVMLHKPLQQQPATGDDGDSGGSSKASAAAVGSGLDVYDEAEADPARSRAVESSLWELAALRNHYCPQVNLAGSGRNTDCDRFLTTNDDSISSISSYSCATWPMADLFAIAVRVSKRQSAGSGRITSTGV